MTSKTKKHLLIAGGVAVAGALGYLAYKKMQASATLPTPGPLPGTLLPPSSTPVNLTLSPGAMSTITMSVANKDTLSLFAPTNGELGNATVTPGILASPTTNTPYEYVAAAPGSGSISVAWRDPTGTMQTSTIPVTVTA